MRNLGARRLPAALALTLPLVVGTSGTGIAAAAPATAVQKAPVTRTPAAAVQQAPASLPAAAAVRQAAPGAPAEAAARRALRALEVSFKGRIGAYAVDTATGRTVGHRSRERFPMVSTFKAVACAAVLRKARTSEPGLMGKVVRWSAAQVKPNSPVTAKHVKDGLTVARLCEAAITVSDNTAANMILKQIGGPAGLTRYLRSLKDPVSRLDRWETELNDWSPRELRDTTTPAAMAGDLRAVAVGNALDPRDRDQLKAWLMATQTGAARIRAGLPKTWTIGHKTGTGGTYGTANDVAVVWPKGSSAPIVMAIYTNRRAADAAVDEKVLAKAATILARGLGRL